MVNGATHEDRIGVVDLPRKTPLSAHHVPPDGLDTGSYRIKETKSYSKANSIIRKCRYDLEFLWDYILYVDLDDCQKKVFESVWKGVNGEMGEKGFSRTAWVAANGVGKTFTVAAIALGAAFTFRPIKVIITSKTGRQAEGQTWDEVKRIYKKSPFFQDLIKAGAPFGHLQETRLRIKPGHFILHFSVAGGKSADDIEAAFEGWHQKNVMLIIDEAKRTHPAIWQSGERFFTNTHEGWHRMLAVGSAGAKLAPFGKCFYGRGASKWKQHRTTAFESPRVSDERAQEIIDVWGNSHPLTRSMVFAEFTDQDADSLFPVNVIEFCTRYETDENNPVEPDVTTKKGGHGQCAIDWARSGDCETVFAARKGGYCFDLQSWKKKKGVWSCGKVLQLHERFPKFQMISDETGLGGGIQDFVEEIQNETGKRVTIQGLLVGQEPLRDDEHFLNIRAEMFFELARRMQRAYDEQDKSICSIPDDPELRQQLANIKYEFTSKGKMKIMSKEKMIKEGIGSPDKADAVAMTFYEYPLPGLKFVEVEF